MDIWELGKALGPTVCIQSALHSELIRPSIYNHTLAKVVYYPHNPGKVAFVTNNGMAYVVENCTVQQVVDYYLALRHLIRNTPEGHTRVFALGEYPKATKGHWNNWKRAATPKDIKVYYDDRPIVSHPLYAVGTYESFRYSPGWLPGYVASVAMSGQWIATKHCGDRAVCMYQLDSVKHATILKYTNCVEFLTERRARLFFNSLDYPAKNTYDEDFVNPLAIAYVAAERDGTSWNYTTIAGSPYNSWRSFDRAVI